jgi:hypothetical protein
MKETIKTLQTKSQSETPKGRGYLEELGVDGRIILRWM